MMGEVSERILAEQSAALTIKSHLEQRPDFVNPGILNASALALCPVRATFDVLGREQSPVTSRKAARINTSNLVGRGFRDVLLAELATDNEANIFTTDLQLEIVMSPGCVLRERVDYIVIEEDGSLRPVILRPTLTHDWKPINSQEVIAHEDRTRLLIACRMLEKVGALNGRSISTAEIVYICLGGNQYTNGSVRGFPVPWDNTCRQEIIDYVNGWHQRFLAGDDQPISNNPDCVDFCPFDSLCAKSKPGDHTRQLSLDSFDPLTQVEPPHPENEPLLCFDCGGETREDARRIKGNKYKVDTVCTCCGALLGTKIRISK